MRFQTQITDNGKRADITKNILKYYCSTNRFPLAKGSRSGGHLPSTVSMVTKAKADVGLDRHSVQHLERST